MQLQPVLFYILLTLGSLTRLNVSNNSIATIRFLDGFTKLSFLNLNANGLRDWHSVHALNNFPCLTQLRFKDNPILLGISFLFDCFYLLNLLPFLILLLFS